MQNFLVEVDTLNINRWLDSRLRTFRHSRSSLRSLVPTDLLGFEGRFVSLENSVCLTFGIVNVEVVVVRS